MNNEEVGSYGYTDDDSQVSGQSALSFGLNAGVARMIKFEWTPNGGKGGAEAEALDITFNVNSADKSYRMFPVTKAFLTEKEGGGETTDPKHPAMVQAYKDFNAIMTHILHCFVPKDDIVTAFSVPLVKGDGAFKQYCAIAQSLLPTNFADIALDIFAQFQWQIKGENTRTFLEIPPKMKHGRWLSAAVSPQADPQGDGAEWKEVKKDDPKDNDANALTYVDGAGNIHPFTRNGWYMKSNFANQVKEDGGEETPAINAQPGADAQQAPAKGWGEEEEETTDESPFVEETTAVPVAEAPVPVPVPAQEQPVAETPVTPPTAQA